MKAVTKRPPKVDQRTRALFAKHRLNRRGISLNMMKLSYVGAIEMVRKQYERIALLEACLPREYTPMIFDGKPDHATEHLMFANAGDWDGMKKALQRHHNAAFVDAYVKFQQLCTFDAFDRDPTIHRDPDAISLFAHLRMLAHPRGLKAIWYAKDVRRQLKGFFEEREHTGQMPSARLVEAFECLEIMIRTWFTYPADLEKDLRRDSALPLYLKSAGRAAARAGT